MFKAASIGILTFQLTQTGARLQTLGGRFESVVHCGRGRSSDEESDIEGMAVIGEDGESLDDDEDDDEEEQEEKEESAFKDATSDTAGPPEQCKQIRLSGNTEY